MYEASFLCSRKQLLQGLHRPYHRPIRSLVTED
jgi:hypothetical protein